MMSKLIQELRESPEQSQNICTKYIVGSFVNSFSRVLLYSLKFHITALTLIF